MHQSIVYLVHHNILIQLDIFKLCIEIGELKVQMDLSCTIHIVYIICFLRVQYKNNYINLTISTPDTPDIIIAINNNK
jgi:hypothetical protein